MISVIVPVYNVEKYLSRCIDSIINQTYLDIEVLLIDDGSTDSSGKICDEYAKKDNRIRVFHLENGGVSLARNYGIDKSNGDFICFVDSDDWLEKNALEEMLSFIKEQGVELGIFSFRSEFGKTHKDYFIDELSCTPKELFQNANNLKSFNGLVCSPCNKLYKSKIIKDNNLSFNNKIKFGEDFIFNSYYLRYCKNLASKNLAYYHYDNTIESSGVKKVYENYDEYIIAMQIALQDAIQTLKIDNYETLKLWFIGERWEYAIDNCLNSSLSIEKKAQLLNNWLLSISPEYLSFLSNRNGDTAILLKSISKEDNINTQAIEKSIKQINKIKRKKSRLKKLKNIIKKIIK